FFHANIHFLPFPAPIDVDLADDDDDDDYFYIHASFTARMRSPLAKRPYRDPAAYQTRDHNTPQTTTTALAMDHQSSSSRDCHPNNDRDQRPCRNRHASGDPPMEIPFCHRHRRRPPSPSPPRFSPTPTSLRAFLSLTLFLSLLLPCLSACNYRYNWSCSSSGSSTTLYHTFSFTADSSSSSGGSYAAAATFSWDEGAGDSSAVERRTGTFSLGEESVIEESYVYDQRGTYETRFTLFFGEGAGSCEGYFYEQVGQFTATTSCTYNDSLTGLTRVAAPPTDFETNTPLMTPVPTESPVTPSPVTLPPAPEPTTSPPTPQPVSTQTDPPTDPPTNPPTTRPPTKPPTPSPSNPPTKLPTSPPTHEPSFSPTTPGPTRSPVEGPQPTQSPTVPPPPTETPTAPPTTLTPTNGPNGLPTTPSPSQGPNALPSPTEGPGALPSPTDAPSETSTIPLRVYPVPTEITFHVLSSRMQGPVLDDWTKVTEARIKKHSEAELAKSGEDEIVVTVELDDIEQWILEDGRRHLAAASAETHPQHLQQPQHRRLGRGRNSTSMPTRDLQLDNPLQITYVTTLSFRSPHSNYNPSQLIAAGFTSPAKQREYLYSLKAADSDYFESVDSFVMALDGQVVTEDGGVIAPITDDDTGNGGNGNDFTLYYAIGGAAGGASLCILLIGGAYFLKRKRRRTTAGKEKTLDGDAGTAKGSGTPAGGYDYNGNVSTGMHSHGSPYGSNPDSGPTQATSYFGTIESREGEGDDVSTLGEPYFGDAVPSGMVDRDDTVADSILSSEGELFVFGVGRPRLNTGGASKMDSTTYTGTTSNRMQHLFGDDDTLENIYNNANAVEQQHIPPYDEEDSERLTVVAPAGKLGIVIDNPGGEVPVVHAIKETSVLHGRVNVGDLLLSVDEQDCRGMSAVAVSKLISSRSENPTRTLVLLRGAGVVS
ncbi:hypothetical protein ACHAXS_005618, partial [Conticribra weissflogii]